MSPQDERELALRIRMALASQAQSDLQLYRAAASRLAEQPSGLSQAWSPLAVGPL